MEKNKENLQFVNEKVKYSYYYITIIVLNQEDL